MVPLQPFRLALPSLALVAFALACGGGGGVTAPPPPPPPPAPGSVASVALSETDLALVPQSSVQLTATPKDGSGNALTGKNVTWQTSAAAVASVSSTGLVTGVALGTATITATSDGKNATATVNVRDGVLIGAAGGTVTTADGNAKLTIPAGALTTTLPISVTPLTGAAAAGALAGTAYELGPSGTIFNVPVQLEFKYPYNGGVDSSRALYRLSRFTNGAWVPLPGSSGSQSGNKVVAQTSSFSSYGIVSGGVIGTLTVTPQQPVILVGQSRTFSAPTIDESFLIGRIHTKQRNWSVIGGITVNQGGVVTGVQPDPAARVFVGDAYTFPCTPQCSLGFLNYGQPNQVEVFTDAITVVTSGFADVTVALVPVKAISLSPPLPQMSVGATQQLTANLKDSVGGPLTTQFRSVTWATSNSLVATVSAAGLVTSVAPGTATISATAEGIVGSTVVTVTGSTNPVVSVTVTPTLPTIEVGTTVTLTVTPKDAGGQPVPGHPIVWTTLNPAVATVSQSGVVTAVSPGQAGIGALVDGIQSGALITVVAPYPLVVGIPAAGSFFSCLIRSNATTWCWGAGSLGQLGTGTTPASQYGPVQLAGGGGFTAIAAGYDHTCALGAGGAAYCWGINGSGQLGNNSTTSSSVPVPVSGPAFTKISAGHFHSCGLVAGGAAYCWGASGYIGDGTNVTSPIPVAVQGGRQYNAIAAGNNSTCALTSGGAAWCWGNGGNGELGNGTNTYDPVAPPVQVAGGLSFTRLVGGIGGQFCGLTAAGDAYCWGRGTSGVLGAGSLSNSNTPVKVATSVKFTTISAGGDLTCALAVDGTAWCWGVSGMIGSGLSGLPQIVPTPTAVFGGRVYTDISAGGGHACARAADGTWCWGTSSNGQLGTGINNNGLVTFETPQKVRFQ